MNPAQSGAFTLFTIATTLLSLATTIVWIVVGWRAMRAHETIAELLREKKLG